MCFSLPYQVVSITKNQFVLELLGQRKKAKKTLIKVRPGDFVLVQNEIIIKKVSKKDVQELLKLISKYDKQKRR